MTRTTLPDERRKNPRVPTNVRCWLERQSITLYGTVTNLSKDGLFLCTPVTLAVGNDVSLSLDLGGGVVTARGHIVWANPGPSVEGPPGIGIAIDEVEKGLSALTRFVEERLS